MGPEELRFTDESRVDGVVQWDATHRNLRLSDFLNWCDDFFVLRTGFGMLVKNAIERDEAPFCNRCHRMRSSGRVARIAAR